jgi:hypothetical protein
MARPNIFTLLHERVMKDQTLSEQEKNARLWFRHYQRAIDKFAFPPHLSYDTIRQQMPDKQVVPGNAAQRGRLYFFRYQAQQLRPGDYYDALPFVLVTDTSSVGFSGLNFHYLPYRTRAIFMDAMVRAQTVDYGDTLKTKIDISVDELKKQDKYKAYRGCYRSYRTSALRSPLLQVGETQWATALFLPVELFRGASTSTVWNAAQRRIVRED